jgi:hypothetical protein
MFDWFWLWIRLYHGMTTTDDTCKLTYTSRPQTWGLIADIVRDINSSMADDGTNQNPGNQNSL